MSLERHFCKPVAINTKLNTGVTVQPNKLDLATSHVARLQHHMAICAIVSITVTTATTVLWLKHRIKHISSGGPYLSSRKSANSASLLSPYKSRSSLHHWNDTFYSAFLRQSSYFFSLTWAMLGQFLALLLLSVLLHCLQVNISDQVRAGTTPVQGRGTAQYLCEEGGLPAVCTRMTDTSQTLPLVLIGCVVPGAVDSCKSN